MVIFSYLFLILHLLGLALGLGSATVKTVLLLRCKSDHRAFVTYFKITKPVTKLIIAGMILLTLSGIGWLLMGYPFNTLLIIKLILVALLWISGPIIDNVIEPKIQQIVAVQTTTTSAAFINIHRQYLAMELIATSMMFAVTLIGVFL